MIAIVDFGSQTTHLIGRRLQELNVASLICHPEDIDDVVANNKLDGIILSGGPASVYATDAPTISDAIFVSGLPILGICYGCQLMAQKLGGIVQGAHKEYGPQTLNTGDNSQMCTQGSHVVWMSHGDSVTELPIGFNATASTPALKNAIIENSVKKFYGVQFHPEVEHTAIGKEILQKFLDICGAAKSYFELNPDKIIEQIKQTVGNNKVICAVSGGVDSTVAASLIAKAIGKNLICVHVDSGLMQDGTTELVNQIFSDEIPATLIVVEAQERFMSALKGIEDPEIKRKTIGKLYIDIFQEIALQHKDVVFLAQGTIYSDVIESKGSKNASNIKSHHNVGGLPADMKLKLLEPNRHLYKDQVRMLGRKIGLTNELVNRYAFPGPGYAIRIRGEVTPIRLNQVKIADAVVIDELEKAGIMPRLFQAFAIMTGAYSTANKGDERAFAEVVAVRAYESLDVMTASWADLPRGVLEKISTRIVNEVPNISRVVYDITTKPPATMEWE